MFGILCAVSVSIEIYCCFEVLDIVFFFLCGFAISTGPQRPPLYFVAERGKQGVQCMIVRGNNWKTSFKSTNK